MGICSHYSSSRDGKKRSMLSISRYLSSQVCGSDAKIGGAGFPANLRARKTMCICPVWLRRTRQNRYFLVLWNIFKHRPSLQSACSGAEGLRMIRECLKRVSVEEHLPTLAEFYFSFGDGGKTVALAFLLMLKYSFDKDIVDTVCKIQCELHGNQPPTILQRCEAYTNLVKHVVDMLADPLKEQARCRETQWDHLLPSTVTLEIDFPMLLGSKAESSITKFCDSKDSVFVRSALRRIHEAIEAYLDRHKINAYKSTIYEPLRLYNHIVGKGQHVSDTGHWLYALNDTLGVRLPILPTEYETSQKLPCKSVWDGLKEETWSYFSESKNFGKSFEDIDEFKAKGSLVMLLAPTQSSNSVHPADSGELKEKEGPFASGEVGDLEDDIRKFAYFFSADFLIPRMFRELCAERLQTSLGFSKACKLLFPLFLADINGNSAPALWKSSPRKSHRFPNYFLVPHVRKRSGGSSAMLLLMEGDHETIDTERVSEFFFWLGVTKAESMLGKKNVRNRLCR